jgi:hypothetical protein
MANMSARLAIGNADGRCSSGWVVMCTERHEGILQVGHQPGVCGSCVPSARGGAKRLRGIPRNYRSGFSLLRPVAVLVAYALYRVAGGRRVPRLHA